MHSMTRDPSLSRLRKRPLEADAATSARAAGEIDIAGCATIDNRLLVRESSSPPGFRNSSLTGALTGIARHTGALARTDIAKHRDHC